MTKGLAVIFGGSGFVGSYLARELVDAGWRIRIACRRPHIVPQLKLSGSPGMVDMVQCNVRNKDSVSNVLNGADAAIYLPGILYERGNQTFEAVHSDGVAHVVSACATAGISNFVHISALGAADDADSRYAKTKARGEARVLEALPSARIIRPSIVFGQEDDFFNRFAAMTGFSPFLPAVNFGETRFQPVYVNDLARGIVNSLDPKYVGQTFEAVGPTVYDFNALFDFLLSTIGKSRIKLPLPLPVMEIAGLMFGTTYRYVPPFSWGLFGQPPLTGDQMRSLRNDNVATGTLPTLTDLGVNSLASIEAIVPSYLWMYRQGGEFYQTAENEPA